MMNEITFLEYTTDDLLFIHWFKRKREFLSKNQLCPKYIEDQLDLLRPKRNPNTSIFILD